MSHSGKPTSFVLVSMFMALFSLSLVNASEEWPQPAKLFANLPDYCPTPDAFAITPDGSLILSCPNYADGSKPGVFVRISDIGDICRLVIADPESGIGNIRPMGIDFGPDGELYVAANGMILKMILRGEKLENVEVIARGLNGPNGLRYHNGAVYTTLPKLPNIKTEKLTSGVYRFEVTDRDIEVTNDESDDHLIFTSLTQNPNRQFGLDGLVFDSAGNLFVGDFGDAAIYKLVLDQNGNVVDQSLFVDLDDSIGLDGMTIDPEGNLYVAGFCKNQISKIDPERNFTLIAQYGDNDGSNGQLDQPADLIVYGKKLVISNFDLMVAPGMINTSHGKPFTLSYIDL